MNGNGKRVKKSRQGKKRKYRIWVMEETVVGR